ncbi:Guanine nucleotide-binding protein G(i) subunit alpha-2 [Fusarium oxysporum f. sp. albedinis]|nr:Guanine nucleotide-binding protein G(i) subunit alpha-2 [Fusarium oxysporum f. sp. albedinis]
MIQLQLIRHNRDHLWLYISPRKTWFQHGGSDRFSGNFKVLPQDLSLLKFCRPYLDFVDWLVYVSYIESVLFYRPKACDDG